MWFSSCRWLVVVSFVLVTTSLAFAEQRTFADLLARAQAQAAAGHQSSPPGDNMTETVSGMMDLISSATPKQLAELAALLEPNPSVPPPSASVPLPRASVSEPPASVAPPSIKDGDTAPLRPASPATPPGLVSPAILPGLAVPPSRPDLASPATPPAPASPATPSALVSPAVPSALASPATPPAAVDIATIPDHPASKIARQFAPRPGPRAKELFARGKQAEREGNISGARRFYASAAEQGDPTAARDLGRLYDPVYLAQITVGGIDPDPVLARYWYERAVIMGDAVAGPLLEALSVR